MVYGNFKRDYFIFGRHYYCVNFFEIGKFVAEFFLFDRRIHLAYDFIFTRGNFPLRIFLELKIDGVFVR